MASYKKMTPRSKDFLGHWRVERSIADALSQQSAQFTGTAEISDRGADWLYAETGQLQILHTKPMLAERRYLWCADEMGFDIFFEDGRFFHRLNLQATTQAAHWCDPDQYDVSYDFTPWPSWQSAWSVVGPKKNYVMKTTYSRV